MPRRNKQTPHTPYNPPVNCQSKRRFPSEQAARANVDERMLIDVNLKLTTYKCPYCNGWHLTRSNSQTQ